MHNHNSFTAFRADFTYPLISFYELRQCAPWNTKLCCDLLDAIGSGSYCVDNFPEPLELLEPQRSAPNSSAETEDGYLKCIIEQHPSNYDSQTPQSEFLKAKFSKVDFPAWYSWHSSFFKSTNDRMDMWDRLWIPIRIVAHYAKQRNIPLPMHWKAVLQPLVDIKAFQLGKALKKYDREHGHWPAKDTVVSTIKKYNGESLSDRRIKRIIKKEIPDGFKSGRPKAAEQRQAWAAFEEHFPSMLKQTLP